MRAIYCLAFLGALTMLQDGSAQDPVDLQPLVDKVLKAHGGEQKLNGILAFVEKTTITPAGGTTTLLDRYIQLPDQTRLESQFELQGKRVNCAIVFAGDTGWRKTEDQPTEPYRSAYKGKKDPLKFAGPRFWLRLKDPSCTLALLADAKIGDRPAFGITLKYSDGGEEKLFFDKETSLLIKSGQAQVEKFYDDYKMVDGIPFARKITWKRDGKMTHQIEVTELRVVDKLDAKLFERP